MDKKANGKTSVKLEEKLTSYWELCEQRESLAERLKKVELGKASVSQRIYEKVKGEYRAQLDKVQIALDPLKDELESGRRDIEQELDALTQSFRALEDELSEADFRHEVGEYEEEQISEFRRRVEPRLKEERARARDLEDNLAIFDRRRITDTPTDEDSGSSGDDRSVERRMADDVPVISPADKPDPMQSAADAFENPQSWSVTSVTISTQKSSCFSRRIVSSVFSSTPPSSR